MSSTVIAYTTITGYCYCTLEPPMTCSVTFGREESLRA